MESPPGSSLYSRQSETQLPPKLRNPLLSVSGSACPACTAVTTVHPSGQRQRASTGPRGAIRRTGEKMRSDQVFPKAINGTFSSTRGGSSAARAHDWPDYRDSRCVRPAAHRCQCLHTAGGAAAQGSDLARFFTAQHIQSRQARLRGKRDLLIGLLRSCCDRTPCLPASSCCREIVLQIVLHLLHVSQSTTPALRVPGAEVCPDVRRLACRLSRRV